MTLLISISLRCEPHHATGHVTGHLQDYGL
jgi:hypothetical protein